MRHPARLPHLLGLPGPFPVLTGFRPDDPDSTGLFRFEPGYDVETHDSAAGRVRVHFTRTGPDAVRAADADTDGTPDAVEAVAETYEEALAFYASLGYRSPVSDLGTPTGDGGSDRLDVYLVDFGGASDGAFVRERCELARPICSGYVAQENDYAGYGYPSFRTATRILASHELFHAIQAAYDSEQGANWGEATAVWASERFDPTLSDFEHFIDGWLDEPERAIDQEPIGPVDGYSYGLALFPQYLAERFGDDLLRRTWEDLEDGAQGVADPHWLAVLATLLPAEHDTPFEAAWVEFADWVLRSGHGGPAGATFANAAAYPEVAREAVELPFRDDKLRVYRASMQIWSVAPGARATIAVALPTLDPAEHDGLRLVLATRRGDAVESARLDGPSGEIAAAGADEVLIAVLNTARSGQSRRPGLCLGDPAEGAACVAALAPAPPEPGPEVVEAPDVAEAAADTLPSTDDASADALAPDAAEPPALKPPIGQGCAGAPGSAGLLALLVAAAVAARRRRTRAATR